MIDPSGHLRPIGTGGSLLSEASGKSSTTGVATEKTFTTDNRNLRPTFPRNGYSCGTSELLESLWFPHAHG
jgi:hypothetical protein